MSRPRGGYIGYNAAPAASALNSAASGIWTLREAEALKRAGTWPIAFVSPTQISNLQLWLDAADSATLFDATSGGSLVAADGGVARWEDKSGNANHATEATNGPTRKTGVRNGRDALRFDGSNDVLTTGAISALNTRQITMFAVTSQRVRLVGATVVCISYGDFTALHGNENSQSTLAFSVAGNVTALGRNANGVAVIVPAADRYVHGADELLILGQTVDSAGAALTLVNRFAPSSMTASSGGNVIDTPSLHQTVAIGYQTGPSNFLDGDICEVIIYSATLTTEQRNAVIDYLMGKWGIT